jgi:hypothetical protein
VIELSTVSLLITALVPFAWMKDLHAIQVSHVAGDVVGRIAGLRSS